MALHTGSLTWDKTKRDYEWAPMLNHVARLMAAANGGQILLSRATAELVRGALPEGISLHDHGEHRLKDIKQPMQVYQVLVAGLLTDERSLKTLDVPRHNLPIQPTKFLGREKEVGDVIRLLDDGEKKLVTLIGPGGVGKTRLGLRIAASLIASFDRVVFVDLAPLRDPDLVAAAIAQTLELRETTGERLLDDVIYFLRDKHLFLLLDNFENVVPASAIVEKLLEACPRLTVLVTSLCALKLRREQRYQVLPFPVHDLGCPIVRTDASKSTAICLFRQRARAVDPSFELTDKNVQWVANICWHLDGLPLAIELAASRSDVFPPQALYGKLKSLLSMLTGGASDAPERQQTMRGTIEWSCKLLAPPERDLLWRLAVFAGGCTIETITAICYPLNVQLRSEPDVVESITSLVNKSLLRRDNIRRPTNENPRFTMLQTIREYGLEQLKESGEALPLQEQHALYFAHLVEQEEPRFVDADQEVWLDGIDAEQENIREALTWACESNKADIGLRMAGTLWWFWYVRGSRTEGRDWLKQLFLLSVTKICGEGQGR